MSKVAGIGHGYTRPSYHAMRVTLKDVKQSVQLIVDSIDVIGQKMVVQLWEMGGVIQDNDPLSILWCIVQKGFPSSNQLMHWILRNVVHLVTDNAANYNAAGRLLCEKYPSIVWSPCASHCMKLIMKDMSEMPQVADLVTLASRVTIFVYNHKWPLNWLRKRPGWTEIIRPGATCFGTAFIALKSLCDHKHDLQAMNCGIVVKVMTPMLRLLRICDSDEKSALGYVYEGMMLRKSLHVAAYWLNPVFQYDQESFCKKPEVVAGVIDMIERYSSVGTVNGLTLMDQLKLFREHEGSFGRTLAFASRNATRPDEWWKLHGKDAPELQKFAIRILSETASSSLCERNWSVFERIHTKRRNRLEHQRLNDLVYVHYNLRLQNRLKDHKKSYDPIDYESIDKTEFWVVDEIPEGELSYTELENMVEDEPPNYNESTIFAKIELLFDIEDDDEVSLEQIDMDSFR
ncbi:uncharacterized protein LOC111891608 [Lactuca sativa]|uniref:uncharacterized protein LOC111891608 n=1 Tax=Lactuca sativa TaxID=4236 RepID=UPI000CD904A2|nr:uncharacterized protein LOC111891608 [Lactuca sativa]